MVATRLYEVTAKGTEWAYGGTSATSAAAGGGGASRSGYETPLVPSSPSLSPPASPLPRWNSSSSTTSAHGGGGSSYYWRYAHDSIHTAADATYSAVASLLSSLYSGNNASRGGSAYYHDGDNDNYDQDGRIRTQSHHTMDSWMGGGGGDDLSASLRGTAASTAGTRRMVTPFTLNSSDLAMLLFKNPYNGVRGRHRQPHQPASITAVRALLTLVVPAVDIGEHDDEIRSRLPTLDNDNDGEDDAPLRRGSSSAADWATSASASGPYPASGHAAADDTSSHGRDPFSVAAASSHAPSSHRHHHHHGLRVSPSETASQIAEGTIRALRDLVCDEAVDLQIALRFWTERWERPLFSWIEAGPEGAHARKKSRRRCQWSDRTCSLQHSRNVSHLLRSLLCIFTVTSVAVTRWVQPPTRWEKGSANPSGFGPPLRDDWRIATTFVTGRMATRRRTVGRVGSRWRMGVR